MDVKIKATGELKLNSSPGLKLNGNFQTGKSVHTEKNLLWEAYGYIYLLEFRKTCVNHLVNNESSLNLL